MARALLLITVCLVTASCGSVAVETHSTRSTGAAPPATQAHTPPVSASALRAAVARYLAAYQRRDAGAACAALAPDVRRWAEHALDAYLGRSLTCPQFVSLAFEPGSGDAGPMGPPYTRIRVVSWYPPQVAAGFPEISASVRVMFRGSAQANAVLESPQPIAFYFTRTGGKLLLAKDPPMSHILAGGGEELWESLPPSTPQSISAPVAIKPPTFACSGPPATVTDASADVRQSSDARAATIAAPWLDIRSVTGYGLTTTHPCLAVTLAAPPRAPFDLQVSGTSAFPAEIAVGPGGVVNSEGLDPHVRLPYGERGGALVLALDPQGSPWQLSSMVVCLRSPLFEEPELGQPDAWPVDGWAADGKPSCP